MADGGGEDLELKDLGQTPDMMDDEDPNAARTAADLQAVFDIPVHVSAVLGKANMQVSQLLKSTTSSSPMARSWWWKTVWA